MRGVKTDFGLGELVLEELPDFAVGADEEGDAHGDGAAGGGVADGHVFGLHRHFQAEGAYALEGGVHRGRADGEVEERAVIGGLVIGVFEDLEVGAVADVEHGGAVAVCHGPPEAMGEAEGGGVEGDGGVPIAGLEGDVVKAAAAQDGVAAGRAGHRFSA